MALVPRGKCDDDCLLRQAALLCITPRVCCVITVSGRLCVGTGAALHHSRGGCVIMAAGRFRNVFLSGFAVLLHDRGLLLGLALRSPSPAFPSLIFEIGFVGGVDDVGSVQSEWLCG